MNIGILQTGRSPDELRTRHGDYDDFFKRFLNESGFDFDTYAVLDGQLPASVNDADGWIITGSKFGAYEDHLWIPPLEAFLRDAYTRAVPIVGICFGHQILAQALGGKVAKFKGGWSAGVENYVLDGFSDSVKLIAWHQDQVTELPAGATVAGSSAFCKYAALAYGERAYTIQPHPEFNAEFAADLIEARRDVLPAEIAIKASNGLKTETSSNEVAAYICTFFNNPRRNVPGHDAKSRDVRE